jgi:hypothetical protein
MVALAVSAVALSGCAVTLARYAHHYFIDSRNARHAKGLF